MVENNYKEKEKTPTGGKITTKKNATYLFLRKYLEYQGQKKEVIELETKTNELLDNLNYEHLDSVFNFMVEREDLILKILSECPYISITLNYQNNKY